MTERAIKAKSYLEHIHDLKRLSEVSHMAAVELRESGISRPKEYGMRIQSSGGFDMADRAALIVEKEQKAIAKSIEYAEKVAEATEMILAMDNGRYAEILYRKFINMQTAEQIAEAMGYSVQRVFQLYPQALDSFADTLFL